MTNRTKSGNESQVASIRAFTGSAKQLPMRSDTLCTPCLNQYIRPISSPYALLSP
ncbi:MAG: hypothetical protein ACREF1_14645 [Acetobacteraceae bacterium]